MCKPLARILAMRFFALDTRSQRVLGVGRDLEVHAELGTCAAGAALADDGQPGRCRRRENFDVRLKGYGLGQLSFQCGDIDDPRQGRGAKFDSVKVHLCAAVALDLHVGYRRDCFVGGPATQVLEQLLRRAVQSVSAHINAAVAGVDGHIDEADAQPFTRQQQRQGATDDAAAAYTDIQGESHGRDCRRQGRILLLQINIKTLE